MSQSICFAAYIMLKKTTSEDRPDADVFQQLTDIWVGDVGRVAYKLL